MIENQYPITVPDLIETGRRVLWYTPRFKKSVIVMPAVVLVLLVAAKLIQPATSIWLLLVLAAAMLYYCFRMTKKVPENMANQLYQKLKREAPEGEEPVNHTRMTEGGVLVIGTDDDSDQVHPFSTIQRVFGTENFIVAMNQRNQAILFRRDGFLQGDEKALVATFRTHCPGAKFDEKSIAGNTEKAKKSEKSE